MKVWGSENFLDLLLLESSQCHVWYVPPDGQNCCYFTSSAMLTQKPFTMWCVVGLSPLHGEKKHHFLPSMSRSNNLRLSENVCIFFRDQPSRLYSQGVFSFHNTELLPYRLIQAKGCYLFLIAAWSLFVRLHAFIREQVKLEPFWGRRLWCYGFQEWSQVNDISCAWLLCNLWFASKLAKCWFHKTRNKSQQVALKKRKIRMSGLSEPMLRRSARHRL